MIDAETEWYGVPATVKAVVLSPENRVLLARNHRGQWELPGGWPSAEDASVEDVLRREVLEETGLQTAPGTLLHAELLVVEDRQVMIVAYLCHTQASELKISDEHSDLMWVTESELPPLEFPAYEVAVARAFEALP